MPVPIRRRVASSFEGDASIADAKEYADRLYSTWNDVTKSLARTATLVFLLMAIFELLSYQKRSSEMVLGSISFSNTPLVQTTLPTVIAFLVYDGFRLTARWIDLEYAYSALIKKCMPKAYENDLDVLLKPPLPALWPVGHSASVENANPSERYLTKFDMALGVLIILLLPLAFECQAFYHLVAKFGYRDVFLWVNVAVTTALSVGALVYLYIYAGEEA